MQGTKLQGAALFPAFAFIDFKPRIGDDYIAIAQSRIHQKSLFAALFMRNIGEHTKDFEITTCLLTHFPLAC